VGLFTTALNLIPLGLLDGGHILYAAAGERFPGVSRMFWTLLLPLGLLWWPWLAWAAVFAFPFPHGGLGTAGKWHFFFFLRHPPIYDPQPLGPGRRRLAWLSVMIFVLCFMPAPIATTA
jgi:membrane-associated protease RseP (regulator of RpoE activity)